MQWRKSLSKPSQNQRNAGRDSSAVQSLCKLATSQEARVQILNETGFLPTVSLKWLRGSGGGLQGSKLDLFRHLLHLTVCNLLPLLSVSILLQGSYLLCVFGQDLRKPRLASNLLFMDMTLNL